MYKMLLCPCRVTDTANHRADGQYLTNKKPQEALYMLMPEQQGQRKEEERKEAHQNECGCHKIPLHMIHFSRDVCDQMCGQVVRRWPDVIKAERK